MVLFDIDAAAISLVFDGANSGTLGSSGAHARAYDELQFTLGEGPCLESVATRAPVLVADLADPKERRWPVYGPAMLDHQIRGVFAMPVVVAGEYVGALDLFRAQPGQLAGEDFAGAIVAAELAGIPLLDLLDGDLQAAVNDPGSNAWAELHKLSRAEVSQATGMLVAQLGIEPAEALRAPACPRLRHRPQRHRRRPRHPRPATAGSRPTDATRDTRTEGEMTETPRETRVLDAVVSLVDSLLDDFDVVDLLTELTERCASCSTSPPPDSCSPTRSTSCDCWPPPPSRPANWNSSSCRPTRARASTAMPPANPCLGRRPARRRPSVGPGSFPRRSTPASPRCTPSRCARQASSWAHSACSAPVPANSTRPICSSPRHSRTSRAWRSCRSTRRRPRLSCRSCAPRWPAASSSSRPRACSAKSSTSPSRRRSR